MEVDISGIWIILLAAVVSSVVSTYFPMRSLLKLSVAEMARMH